MAGAAGEHGRGGRRGGPADPAAPTWASELKAYERERRHEVNPGLLQSPPRCLDKGSIARAEREFDTVLQSYRDEGREARQRAFESKEQTAHLNRAVDIQIRRENKFNPVTHEGRLDAIAPPQDFRTGVLDDGTHTAYLTGASGYNIISNLSTDVHHWAHPDLRAQPRPEPQHRRQIPTRNVKDFHIINNRYVEDHEAKTARDRDLNRLEATAKFRQRNKFDPVLQRCPSARADQSVRAAHDAREVEAMLRAQARQPPSFAGRSTAGHDLLSNEVKDPHLIGLHDGAEQARTSRYRTRHLTEMAIRDRDIAFEDQAMAQKNSLIAHERHEETTRRGYDILTNCAYGEGPKDQKKHVPYTVPPLSAWDKALARPPPDPRPAGAPEAAASFAGSLSARRPPRPHSTASTPRRLAEAGSQALSASARGPSPRATAALGSTVSPAQAAAMAAPPVPTIPGTSSGSVYSQPRGF